MCKNVIDVIAINLSFYRGVLLGTKRPNKGKLLYSEELQGRNSRSVCFRQRNWSDEKHHKQKIIISFLSSSTNNFFSFLKQRPTWKTIMHQHKSIENLIFSSRAKEKYTIYNERVTQPVPLAITECTAPRSRAVAPAAYPPERIAQ